MFECIERGHNDELGLGAGDQDVWRDAKRERIEFALSNEISDGDAFGPPLDQLAEPSTHFVGDHFVKRRVEHDPLAAAGMGQQHFRIEPRAFRAVRLEKVGGPGQ